LTEDDIAFFPAPNRPPGEAFVRLHSEEGVRQALAKDKLSLGHRYIEISPAIESEFTKAVDFEEGRLPRSFSDYVARLIGLPLTAGEKDVLSFLHGIPVERVWIARDAIGRPSGQAYVELMSQADLE